MKTCSLPRGRTALDEDQESLNAAHRGGLTVPRGATIEAGAHAYEIKLPLLRSEQHFSETREGKVPIPLTFINRNPDHIQYDPLSDKVCKRKVPETR